MAHRKWFLSLILIVAGAVILKAVLLAADVIPFNADEAVVALMARHILEGERPWFFYGQAYMGSLDAYLIAGAFALLGESVLAVRLVQVVLFALTVFTWAIVAYRFTGDRKTALVATLLLAFPSVLITLYTTVTLGGYGEALLIGNLLLWWGHRLGTEDESRLWLWALWGIAGGIGFWTLGISLVYLVPMALWLLWRLRAKAWKGYIVAIVAFALGSSPWWLGNRGKIVVGIGELLGFAILSTSTAETFPGNVQLRLFNLLLFGLTGLMGLRYPWRALPAMPILAIPTLAVYLGILGYNVIKCLGGRHHINAVVWGIWATLLTGFLLTPFGGDPSGRYFLPLSITLTLFTAQAWSALKERIGHWSWLIIGLILVFNIASTANAAWHSPPGITTQLGPITQIDHRYDDDLIAFLTDINQQYGYTNYWVTYPIAFHSNEEVILLPRLSYKSNLEYTSRDDRYTPYGERVEDSQRVVYVTTNHRALDRRIRSELQRHGVTFEERQIGSYHVFHDLSQKITPDQLDIYQKEDESE